MHRGLFVLLFITLGCSPKVINYVNPKSNFTSYQSYIITNVKIRNADLSREGLEIINSIEAAAKVEMEKRAYQESGVEPDLVLRYEIISNRVTDVNVNRNFGYFTPFPYQSITARTFLESALLFELRDLKSNKAVWNASMDLNKYKKKNKTDEITRSAVQQIFETYPYKAGSSQPDQSLIQK